ncbi:hypothetical protein FOZ63_008375, partial [Perkinsus olseni]
DYRPELCGVRDDEIKTVRNFSKHEFANYVGYYRLMNILFNFPKDKLDKKRNRILTTMLTERLITGVSAAAAIAVFTRQLPLATALGLAVAPHNPANDYPPLDKGASKFYAHNAAHCIYSNSVIHIVGPFITTARRARKRIEIDVNATSLHMIEVHCPAAENRSAFDI